MDRLQQAIKKAREQRDGVTPPPVAVEVAARPSNPARVVAPAAASNAVQEVWRDLKPLTINPKVVVGNRLLAYSGGTAAIPYDMLRTKMLQQARKNGWKRIALVSPSSGCGKTTTAANLGLSLSRMRDMRSMVLDFDLRRMGLARALGQLRGDHQLGMGAVLERRVPFRDLALCHDGNVAFGLNSEPVRNPSEILQSKSAADVLAEIEEIYKPDIMIFDTPPLMASDDAHGFLQQVDAGLLLAAAEKTPMDQIDVAERQLAGLTNVMGIVLNRCRYTSGAHGYEGEYY